MGDRNKLGWNATFSMAVGGMVGGGIFSVLGVVFEVAGSLAWLSFVVGGAVALATASSYLRLTSAAGKGGGAFTFLREIDRGAEAAVVSWILILGYVLTTAVYAFTFGHYLSHVVGGGPLLARLLAVAAVATLVAVNVRGVGDASAVEVVTVWGKLAVLGGLAAIGLARWDVGHLSRGVDSGGLAGVLIGGATVFMAYEGFQLLTYDYDDVQTPDRTLRSAVLPAVAVVIGVYVTVAVGAAMLVGAGTLVEMKEVALAAAGEEAAGTPGKVLVSIAAAFSAASAINATLFATARLARRAADAGELPGVLGHRSGRGTPDAAVVALGLAGTVLAAAGSLSSLVEAASLMFLLTFLVVDILAARTTEASWVAWSGAAGAGVAACVLTGRVAVSQPFVLAGLVALVGGAAVTRRVLARR